MLTSIDIILRMYIDLDQISSTATFLHDLNFLASRDESPGS